MGLLSTVRRQVLLTKTIESLRKKVHTLEEENAVLTARVGDLTLELEMCRRDKEGVDDC